MSAGHAITPIPECENLPPRGRPTAEQAARIADRLVDAAWEILLESGPEAFTIERLAAAAHASKQTIYARYSGKVAVLQAVLDSRIEFVSAQLARITIADTLHRAFAELAERLVLTLSHPEARMLDRLTDWLDAADQPAGDRQPNRAANYARMRDMMRHHLENASRRWPIRIDNIPRAAEFWLDGLVGHARALPQDERGHAEWAEDFTRFFLNAVARPLT